MPKAISVGGFLGPNAVPTKWTRLMLCCEHSTRDRKVGMKWTEWKKIETASGRSEPAAYRIALLDAAGSPFPINRMLGTDREGRLSIGKTANMESRRAQFLSGMNKCYGHSEGNLLYLLL